MAFLFFSVTGLTWPKWAGANIAELRAQLGWGTPGLNTQIADSAAAQHHKHGEHAGHETTTTTAAGIDAGTVEIKPAADATRAWVVREIDRSWPTQVDMALIAVGLGWFAPVMGVSLVVFLVVDGLLALRTHKQSKSRQALIDIGLVYVSFAQDEPNLYRLMFGGRVLPKGVHPRLDCPYDAIVIGSGIGGLTTAACMSKLGRKVVVFEQHYTAGGFTHSYDRNGYEWDVGVHYIGDVGADHTLSKRLFDHITDGQLKWAPMDSHFDRIFIGNRHVDLVAGPDAFKAELAKEFPGEEQAIDTYLDYLK